MCWSELLSIISVRLALLTWHYLSFRCVCFCVKLGRLTCSSGGLLFAFPQWPLATQTQSTECLIFTLAEYSTLLINAIKKLHGLSPRANYTDRATVPCRRSDCQLFADRGCHVVSVTDPYGRILGFYQVAPQLCSRGWVDPVPDPLLFFFRSTRDPWICSQELWPLDRRGGHLLTLCKTLKTKSG
jgi:hypothetical protein